MVLYIPVDDHFIPVTPVMYLKCFRAPPLVSTLAWRCHAPKDILLYTGRMKTPYDYMCLLPRVEGLMMELDFGPWKAKFC